MKTGHKNPSLHSFRAWQIGDGRKKNVDFLHKDAIVEIVSYGIRQVCRLFTFGNPTSSPAQSPLFYGIRMFRF